MGARSVIRLHLRSTIEGVDHVAIEDWCLRGGGDGWVGVGWGLWDSSRDGIAWPEYMRFQERAGHAVNDSVIRLHDLPTESLVWTRRRDSSYWLGEITGPWEYRDGDEAQALDLFNIRPCRWWRVGTQDSVPGVIVGNFNQRKTLNPVANRAAARYSRRLHLQLAGSSSQIDSVNTREVVESLLGWRDLEDLIAVYLQDVHELVLVNRGSSTVGYEYVLRHRKSGRRAVATVKSGGAKVDLDALPIDPQVDVWAYSVNGDCYGSPRKDIRWISTNDLVEFIANRPQVLPDQVERWLDR